MTHTVEKIGGTSMSRIDELREMEQRTLAEDIGIKRLAAVVNRVSDKTDVEAIQASLSGIPIVGTVPYDDRLVGGVVQGGDEQQMTPTDVLIEMLPNLEQILKQRG